LQPIQHKVHKTPRGIAATKNELAAKDRKETTKALISAFFVFLCGKNLVGIA
jgi:hypothetical protein